MEIDVRGFNEISNEVIIVSDKVINSDTGLKKSEAENIDSYITYNITSFGNKISGYTRYIIKERILDQNKNLILICDQEYVRIE